MNLHKLFKCNNLQCCFYFLKHDCFKMQITTKLAKTIFLTTTRTAGAPCIETLADGKHFCTFLNSRELVVKKNAERRFARPLETISIINSKIFHSV